VVVFFIVFGSGENRGQIALKINPESSTLWSKNDFVDHVSDDFKCFRLGGLMLEREVDIRQHLPIQIRTAEPPF
jgi:hypothetical protein